ncbi:MAG: thiamine phosphate synthase, partial [Gammaproteobacteria bacterium]|nr:thiamine phosphate synthase [Gammaproteobacteria bacterium]
MKGLYAITDCDRLSTDSLLAVTEEILRAGVVALQYRDKSGNHARRKYEAAELWQLCREHDCLFIINDDLQLAVLTGSDGVHLGREDCDCKTARNELGPGAIIGVSCYNSLGMALAAQEDGADYVAFGSFFPSPSKQNTVTAEPDIIKRAKANISLPVAAIGGITPANCRALIEHGAD